MSVYSIGDPFVGTNAMSPACQRLASPASSRLVAASSNGPKRLIALHVHKTPDFSPEEEDTRCLPPDIWPLHRNRCGEDDGGAGSLSVDGSRSTYPTNSHERRGKEVGLPPAVVDAIVAGRPAAVTGRGCDGDDIGRVAVARSGQAGHKAARYIQEGGERKETLCEVITPHSP
jgi:hypothetical protein